MLIDFIDVYLNFFIDTIWPILFINIYGFNIKFLYLTIVFLIIAALSESF